MAPKTYPPYLREKARSLRRERKLTIDQLAERLALPRTTIYYWVRDLPIPRDTAEPRSATGCSRNAAEAQAAARGGIRRGAAKLRRALRRPDVP